MQQVKRHVIYREDLITTVYRLVDDGADALGSCVVILKVTEQIEFSIDTRCELEMYPPLELKQTRLHAEEVITLRFLKLRITAT